MKHFLRVAALFLIAVLMIGAIDNSAQTQVQSTDFVTILGSGNVPSYTKIDNYAVTYATNVTSAPIDVGNAKTVYLNISLEDTAQFIVSYALSVDGTNYGAFTLIDSLEFRPAASVSALNTQDLTTICKGATFIKLKFDADTIDVTSAQFSATQMSAAVKKFSN